MGLNSQQRLDRLQEEYQMERYEVGNDIFVKLHSNLQTQLNFSWFE